MQYINMSGNLPMGIAENPPRVRYSAAYPTGAERIENSRVEHVERVEVFNAETQSTQSFLTTKYTKYTKKKIADV